MKKSSTIVTPSEREVLELLWTQDRPLTSSEIVELSKDKTWKPSYIHLMITSLLKKNMIEISGFKKTTKNYARSFVPVMSREEYSVYIMKKENNLSTSSLSLLFSALLEEETSQDTLDELSAMLEKKRKELEAGE